MAPVLLSAPICSRTSSVIAPSTLLITVRSRRCPSLVFWSMPMASARVFTNCCRICRCWASLPATRAAAASCTLLPYSRSRFNSSVSSLLSPALASLALAGGVSSSRSASRFSAAAASSGSGSSNTAVYSRSYWLADDDGAFITSHRFSPSLLAAVLMSPIQPVKPSTIRVSRATGTPVRLPTLPARSMSLSRTLVGSSSSSVTALCSRSRSPERSLIASTPVKLTGSSSPPPNRFATVFHTSLKP